MTGKVIFIGGVHGVGKGTLARQVSEATGIRCFSASDLIKERKRAPIDHQKNVIDAETNQDCLVRSVLEKAAIYEKFILDGHFTLWSDQEIIPIPLSVFRDLSIHSIILVNELPETITSRLYERDGNNKTIEQVDKALKEESKHAQLVRQELGVPMLTINSNQPVRAIGWVRELSRV